MLAILLFPYHVLFLYEDFDVFGASEEPSFDFCIERSEACFVDEFVCAQFFD
jgi:hypothetical protein